MKALTFSDSAQIQITEHFTELCEAEVPFLLTTVNCAVRSTIKVYCNFVILFLRKITVAGQLFETKQVVAPSQTSCFVSRFCISETWLFVL